VKCPLCGHEFDENGPEVKSKCQACLFGKKCPMVCCPNCGYTTPKLAERPEESSDEQAIDRAEEDDWECH
jgi:uncharacterized Zn finger protein